MFDRDGCATDRLAVSRRGLLKGMAGTGVYAAAGGARAGATADVVVRAADVAAPVALDADPVAALKATARRSQRSVVDYVERTDGLTLKNRFWLVDAVLVGVDADVVDVERLAAGEAVRRVHPNHEFRLPEPDAATAATADGDATYGLDQMDVPETWETFDARGAGATVAVLDTGVDVSHPDVTLYTEDSDDPTYPGGWAEFDGDGAEVEGSTPRDTAYHGTHVSGTVAGGDASGRQIGVAPEADLLAGLAIPDGSGTFAQLVGAMQWAVEAGADVVNMSLGATGFFGEFVEAVRNAERAGTVVVSSAGNSGEGSSGSPGNVLGSLSVGASDERRAIADFSSGEVVDVDEDWGLVAPDDWPASFVVPDVAAPGVDVTSAVPADADFEGRWTELSGTSMAAPHVAGLVALMESAAEASFDPDQTKAAIATTAEKPADAPDGRDTRFGAGIVDALAATGRVAADGGVTGVVADADGDPIPDATVTLSGFPVETGSEGRYRLRATPGEYELTVEAFGFATRTVAVEVPDGFATRDVALADALAVSVREGQPEGIEGGRTFEYDVGVANVEAVTVERAGDFDGEVTVTLDGGSLGLEDEPLPAGERVPFEEPLSGTVTVTVETGPDGTGDLALDYTFEGLGGTAAVTTGPTSVFDGPVPVGVVDAAEGGFGADLVALLDAELPPRFRPEVVAPDELLEAVEAGTYGAFVAAHFGGDADLAAEFAAATRLPGTGVVYLDQFGDGSEAIAQLSAATGDPAAVEDGYFDARAPVPVSYVVDADHPIVEGLSGSVDLYTPKPVLQFGGFHAFFEEVDGAFDAVTLADVAANGVRSGPGLAVDDLGRTVLAASLGLSVLVDRTDLTDDAVALLGNAVEFAADAPPVVLVETQRRRVDPGDAVSACAAVEDLTAVAVDLAAESTLAPGDVTVTVDGEPVAPGEAVAFDEPRTGEVRVAAATAADAVGVLALDVEFVTGGDGSTATAVTTGPTAVYAPPLSVPGDVASVDDAVALAVPGEEVVVADGTYREESPRGSRTGVRVDTPGLTVRAAEGADPAVLAPDDLPVASAVVVAADDVTVEGLAVNLRDGATHAFGQGVRVAPGVSGTTVRDVTAGGTTGVFLDSDVSDVVVEGLTAVDASAGVATDFAGGPVDGLTVTGLTLREPAEQFGLGGVRVENATRVEVTGCDLALGASADAGVRVSGPFGGGEGCVVRDNDVAGPAPDAGGCGVFVDNVAAVVEGNDVRGTHTGVRVGDLGVGEQPVRVRDNALRDVATGVRLVGDFAAVEGNVVDAGVGVDFDGGPFGLAANAAAVRHNDLSGTDLPFAGEPDGSDGPPGPFDARLNYLGDRGYDDPVADGAVAYDPFLTAPPGAVDRDAPTAIGTDLSLDPGVAHSLGVPGATDDALSDLLGERLADFDGTVERWSPAAGEWRAVADDAPLDSLSAFRVTPASGVRAVLEFRRRPDVPPDRRDGTPGEVRVEEGWNVVCAPAFGGDEVFEPGTAEIEAVEARDLTPPRSQLGGDATRSAFAGYFVQASEAGTVETDLDAYDPTLAELHEALGLDPVIHEALGPGAAPATAGGDATGDAVAAPSALPTVGDVLSAVPDDEAADALTDVLGARVAAALADAAADAATADVVGDALRVETAGAPSSAAVRTATRRVLRLALGAVVDPGADAVARTAAAAAEAADGSSRSLLGGALASVLGD